MTQIDWLRRVRIPQGFLYALWLLALCANISVYGLSCTYAQIAWKVAHDHSLKQQAEHMRARCRNLRQMTNTVEVRLAPSSLPGFHYSRRGPARVPNIWPVEGRLMSAYGQRIDPISSEGASHTGVDIAAPSGTLVRATAQGTIVLAGRSGGYGRLVIVDHGNGIETYYAHLSRFGVTEGEEVGRGEPVGAVGDSGRVTAPHLHYEVRIGKIPVNPYRFLKPAAKQVANNAFPF